MAQIKMEERIAITLTSIEDLTQDEAAAAMELPLGTLKSHVLRGKSRLREILLQTGWEVSV